MSKKTYNGWANYETWNIALWIQNDETLYMVARQFVRKYKHDHPYEKFVDHYSLGKTPDGVCYTDSNLDYGELNEMMKYL